MMKRFSFLLLVMLCLAATVSAAEFEFAGVWMVVQGDKPHGLIELRTDGRILLDYITSKKRDTVDPGFTYEVEQVAGDSLVYINLITPAEVVKLYPQHKDKVIRITVKILTLDSFTLQAIEEVSGSKVIRNYKREEYITGEGEVIFIRAQ